MTELKRCIYLSTRPAETTNEVVDGIVEGAREANARDDVTGALIGGDDFFFQVIEGPDPALTGLMQRIFADDRHEIEIFQVIPCTSRVFPDWGMAFAPMKQSTIAALFARPPESVDGTEEQRLEALDSILVDAMKSYVSAA